MDAERARAFLLTLPYVVETAQWGGLVFWVGDKAIGGKMFALVNLEPDAKGVCSYAAGPERFHELVEQDGLIPAPYMARIFWVAAGHWAAHRNADWQNELAAARDITYNKLPAKLRAKLDLPERERSKLIRERRDLLAKRKTAAPPKSKTEQRSAKKAAKS
jgi:predicted DNA-binding protein (MmcQ/YjbR family)